MQLGLFTVNYLFMDDDIMVTKYYLLKAVIVWIKSYKEMFCYFGLHQTVNSQLPNKCKFIAMSRHLMDLVYMPYSLTPKYLTKCKFIPTESHNSYMCYWNIEFRNADKQRYCIVYNAKCRFKSSNYARSVI